jgi:ABC-type dipeptide/oligopeptide/nickel transport system permease component
MLRYILSRLVYLFAVTIVVSLIIFLMMHALPGGPFDNGKQPLSAAARANIARMYGLDRPLWEQYVRFIWSAVHLDFGYSYQRPSQTVAGVIGETWPISAFLGAMGTALGVVVGLPLGLVAAVRRNTWADYAATFVSITGLAVPVFVVSTFLLFVLSTQLRLLPTGGWGPPQTWVMPVIAYSLVPMGTIARYTRTGMLEVLGQEYIKTARAKGLPQPRVIIMHAFRNSLIPLLTIGVPLAAAIMTGSIYVEGIFRIPGLGGYFVSSILERDYPMEMTLMLLGTAVMGGAYLITDLLYLVADPRIRLTGSHG